MADSVVALELRADKLRLALRPDLGAAIAGLWRAGIPVLQSCEPAELTLARRSAGFVLAPYSNRLGFRRLHFQDHDYTTAPNTEGSPHSMHGVAFAREWRILAVNAASAELCYEHVAVDPWPFAFTVHQHLALTSDALRLDLTLTNTDSRAQPAGLGWHPYFPKRSRSHLKVEVTERWERDEFTLLPTRRVPQPGIDAQVSQLAVDHCFEGWRGAACIQDEKHSIKITSSMPYLVIYTPGQFPYFAVEPVSHVINAIQMAEPATHGVRTLEPGQAMGASALLEVGPA